MPGLSSRPTACRPVGLGYYRCCHRKGCRCGQLIMSETAFESISNRALSISDDSSLRSPVALSLPDNDAAEGAHGSEKTNNNGVQGSLRTLQLILEDDDKDMDDLAEFEEILASEVHVEVDKLRELAKSGIPHKIRCQVWMYLLGVAKPDRSEEVSLDRKLSQDYNETNKANVEIMKRVKGEVKRYRSDMTYFHEPSVRCMFERTLSAYLNSHMDVDYSASMVHMLGPLICCLEKERDIYYCFEALMTRHRAMFAPDGMSQVLAKFMALFRNLQPSLFESFEEEELEPAAWVAPWFQSLLSRELPLPCVLRLWDTYFALEDGGFELHPYICLAILEMYSDQLMEMDSTELLGFMQHLPRLDMSQILSNAYNMQEKVLAKNLI